MATASRHLCRHLSRFATRPSIKRTCPLQPRCIQPASLRQSFRQLSSTPRRLVDDNDEEVEDFDFRNLQIPEKPYTVADLDPRERANYEVLSKEEQTRYLAVQNHVKAVMESEQIEALSDDEATLVAKEIDRSGIVPNPIEQRDINKLRDGLWQTDEDDEFGQTEDGDDDVSDDLITSVAESEMEVHREIREYTRIAAWDLPMLLQFSKDWKTPDMKKTPLRFRYTTYMGEHHPAAKKVVVEFTTKELAAASSLSEAQRIKLIKLVGVRYNPDKDLVKMSCEKFENPAQNKRYLGDLVGKIIAEAKDKTDTFADVPLDFRHHKPKKTYNFPESWKIGNKEGVKKLAEARQGVRLLEDEERMVDGKEILESYVRAKAMVPSYASPQ